MWLLTVFCFPDVYKLSCSDKWNLVNMESDVKSRLSMEQTCKCASFPVFFFFFAFAKRLDLHQKWTRGLMCKMHWPQTRSRRFNANWKFVAPETHTHAHTRTRTHTHWQRNSPWVDFAVISEQFQPSCQVWGKMFHSQQWRKMLKPPPHTQTDREQAKREREREKERDRKDKLRERQCLLNL